MATTPKKKVTTQDRLAALRQKLESTDMGGGGNAGFWSPKEGKTTIRILPEVGDMNFFFQEVGKHVFGKRGEKRVYCPKFTSGGELDCPVCELVSDLYRAGDKSSKALASQLRVRKMYWMNVIVRGSKDKEDSGPFIYTPGVQVMNQISQIIGDPDYGMITDLEEGTDVVVDRKGKGIETEYQVLPRRNPSPLHEDEDQAQDWLDKAKNLSYVELTEDKDEDKELIGDHEIWLLPYSRIEEEFDLSNVDVDELLSEMENGDDDEEDKPRRKQQPKASSRPARRKVEVEEEDEEDEDEDEDEEPAPAAEARRRIARRSKTR